VGEVPVLPPEKHSQQTFRNIRTPKTHCGYTFQCMKNKCTLKRRTVWQSQLWKHTHCPTITQSVSLISSHGSQAVAVAP